MRYKYTWLFVIVFTSVVLSCDDPTISLTRKAKLFLSNAEGNFPCSYNPYESGTVQYFKNIKSASGDNFLQKEFRNNDMRWDEGGGKYLEIDVPIDGSFSVEVYVVAPCSDCCIGDFGSYQGMPEFIGKTSDGDQRKEKYQIKLKYSGCLPC